MCLFSPLICILLSVSCLTGAAAGSGLEALQEAEQQQLPSGCSGRPPVALRPPVAGRLLCIAATARHVDRRQHVALRVRVSMLDLTELQQSADVAPASSPSAKEVESQPKSSALQGKRLQEPKAFLPSGTSRAELALLCAAADVPDDAQEERKSGS
ncbi:hypothetical protein EYF80_024122 [Liparis tanakae]|uniref:Uncharacterized protein n=1 Tax=Liparis tanakae TaxID=230148 RepID=A0A4Z2HKT2_9TELE|nr:hypothetical protein EYF80_024122 [Liparis tanakae]